MTMGERIKQLRRQKGLTQEELGKYIGVKKAAIMKYEKGNVQNMKRSSIETLSKLFDVTPSYLMCLEENEKNNDNKLIYKRIPVLGSIPAGVPIELIEDIIDYEDISEEMLKGGKQYFALKVKGNSMEPKYLDGDTLIVLKSDDCESGQDAIIMVNGDDGTFKRVFKTDKGITLQPLNNEYMPMFYSNEDIKKLPVRILGVVKEIRRTV